MITMETEIDMSTFERLLEESTRQQAMNVIEERIQVIEKESPLEES